MGIEKRLCQRRDILNSSSVTHCLHIISPLLSAIIRSLIYIIENNIVFRTRADLSPAENAPSLDNNGTRVSNRNSSSSPLLKIEYQFSEDPPWNSGAPGGKVDTCSILIFLKPTLMGAVGANKTIREWPISRHTNYSWHGHSFYIPIWHPAYFPSCIQTPILSGQSHSSSFPVM